MVRPKITARKSCGGMAPRRIQPTAQLEQDKKKGTNDLTLTEEIKQLRKEIHGMNDEMKQLSKEIPKANKDLRQEIKKLRAEVAELKSKIRGRETAEHAKRSQEGSICVDPVNTKFEEDDLFETKDEPIFDDSVETSTDSQ